MGTYTVDGHFYKPVAHESNYETLVNLNWDVLGKLDSGVANVMDPQFAGGAKGDGTTDDSAAIQAAIDSNAAVVYFPGVLTHYRIGTPLEPRNGQRYLGAASAYSGYGSKAARLKTTGANTVIWDLPPSSSHMKFEHLVHEGVGTGVSDIDDIAFQINGGYVSASRWINCTFQWVKWAFSCGNNGWFLSNWLDHCWFSSAPSQLGQGNANNQYVNNNHWTNCTFHASEWLVPMVDINPFNPAAGNWFDNCYFESIKRQGVKILNPASGGVRASYFEDTNNSDATYTTKDGLTRPLPAIDVGGTQAQGFVIENNEFVGDVHMLWGSSVFGAGWNPDITVRANRMGNPWINDAGTRRVNWDASAFRRVKGGGYYPQLSFGDIGTAPLNFPSGIMPVHDAQLVDTWYMQQTDGAAFTIPNPTSASDGRRLKYILDGTNGGHGAITWGSAFEFTGGVAPVPVSGTRITIEFEFCANINAGAGYLYAPATGKWVEVYRSPSGLRGTATWNPASLATGATATTTVTVTGAAVGDVVSVGFSVAVPAGMLLTASVTAANTVTVTLYNVSATNPTDLASGTLTARVWRN